MFKTDRKENFERDSNLGILHVSFVLEETVPLIDRKVTNEVGPKNSFNNQISFNLKNPHSRVLTRPLVALISCSFLLPYFPMW